MDKVSKRDKKRISERPPPPKFNSSPLTHWRLPGIVTGSSPKHLFAGANSNPWMSQEVSKSLSNGLFHLLINGVYWGEITH